MSNTHDYETVLLLPSALTDQHSLVGECGGLSAVFDGKPSALVPGHHMLHTEHGALFVDSDQLLEILDEG